jgi:hypothetical protein
MIGVALYWESESVRQSCFSKLEPCPPPWIVREDAVLLDIGCRTLQARRFEMLSMADVAVVQLEGSEDATDRLKSILMLAAVANLKRLVAVHDSSTDVAAAALKAGFNRRDCDLIATLSLRSNQGDLWFNIMGKVRALLGVRGGISAESVSECLFCLPLSHVAGREYSGRIIQGSISVGEDVKCEPMLPHIRSRVTGVRVAGALGKTVAQAGDYVTICVDRLEDVYPGHALMSPNLQNFGAVTEITVQIIVRDASCGVGDYFVTNVACDPGIICRLKAVNWYIGRSTGAKKCEGGPATRLATSEMGEVQLVVLQPGIFTPFKQRELFARVCLFGYDAKNGVGELQCLGKVVEVQNGLPAECIYQWRKENHLRCPKKFRDEVFQLLLVNHRLKLVPSKDIFFLIVATLARIWARDSFLNHERLSFIE